MNAFFLYRLSWMNTKVGEKKKNGFILITIG